MFNYRVPDPFKSLHPTKRRFLRSFEACSSIVKAARWAKIHRQNHYDWMEDDPAYEKAFRLAEKRAARTLEDEAVRRAHEGLRKAVWYKGKIVGYETEYSDTLLLALLKGNAPDKFRERASLEHTGKDGTPLMPAETARALLHSLED